MLIRITGRLKATPKVIKIPTGATRLSFEAKGPGKVEVVYSIAEDKPVRFAHKGAAVTKVRSEVKLTARPKRITRSVKLCRRSKSVRRSRFRITVSVRKRGPDGSVIDRARSARLCAIIAKDGASTCPKS
jgi:hypothetical protein